MSTKMMLSLMTALVAAGLTQALSPLAQAQSTATPPATTLPADQHEAHHTTDAATLPAAAPTMPAAPMMGAGQMDMSQMMQMMQMMTQSGMVMPMEMTGGGTMMPLGMWRHIDGLIAFYKAELQITEAQLPQWNAVAAVMQSEAKKLRERQAAMRAMMTGEKTGPDQFKNRIALLNAQLDHLKTVEDAVLPLYAVLSDRQKHIADELIADALLSMPARRM